MTTALVWFRQDLRLQDNPALCEAVRSGGAVVPVYIFCPEDEGDWPPGTASRWWLRQSLKALDAGLRGRGSQLIFRIGRAADVLTELVRETGASAVYFGRRYEPDAIRTASDVAARLKRLGVAAHETGGTLLREPEDLLREDGSPYRVFTPFYKRLLGMGSPGTPLAAPERLPGPAAWPQSEDPDAILPDLQPERAEGFAATWQPGEKGALRRLEQFQEQVASYARHRDFPAEEGVSRLSPHLHFGEVSPRTVWYVLEGMPGADTFLRQLVWREFAHHLLVHFPATPSEPLREEFARFPWGEDEAAFRAWTDGLTGYPIVDGGMRQLRLTGWMHNRVRMIVASFLTKDLMIPWQRGAAWFWETLVDADLANNTLGWQWTAGCGADAAPYFRVFNPVLQGAKFDPSGSYVRRWVPELAHLPNEWIHRPWEAPQSVLDAVGVVIGNTYPAPIVDHANARRRALAAFEATIGGAPHELRRGSEP